MGLAVLHGVDLHFSNQTICTGQCLNHTSIGPVIPVSIRLQRNDVTDTKVVFLDLLPCMELHENMKEGSEDILRAIVTRRYSTNAVHVATDSRRCLYTCGTNFHILFNVILPSRSLKQLFTTTSYFPPSKSSIFYTPVNPPQTHLLQIPCLPD